MKKLNRISFGIALYLTSFLAMALVSSAQDKLRDALDFDGDDKADYAVSRVENNTWYVLKSGDNSLGATTFGINDYDTLTPGDYDGDGKGDVAVWRYTDRVWYRLNSSDNSFSAVQFGLIGDEPVQRDYDGDGKTDIAVIRRSGGAMNWYILQSSGGFTGLQFGLNTDYPVPGDYDGDGKFDVAVMRAGANSSSQSYFYIQRSTAGFTAIPWGVGEDFAVPGDYDGDGKTDAAVIRRGAATTDNLTWYVLRSSETSLAANSFGITETDTAMQNDYDGDGKTDIAVWRETEGTFYILRSIDGSFIAKRWGLISDFPIASYDTH